MLNEFKGINKRCSASKISQGTNTQWRNCDISNYFYEGCKNFVRLKVH